VIRASVVNIERAYNDSDDLDNFMENAENEIFSISSDRFSDCTVPIKKSIEAAAGTIQMMLQNRGELTGLSSGFVDIDSMAFGFLPIEMIVIAARCIHTGEKPYKCDICGNNYYDRANYKYQIKTAHKIVDKNEIICSHGCVCHEFKTKKTKK
jgi:replicative DNA helicase